MRVLRHRSGTGIARSRFALPPRAALLIVAGLLPAKAFGADLAASRTDAPAFVDWSGGYLGIEGSAGASYGALEFGPTTIGGRSVPAFKTGDATGRADRSREATTAVGGAFGGWNWQTGPWLYGLEADIAGANLKRPVASTAAGFGYEAVDPGLRCHRRQDGPLRLAARARRRRLRAGADLCHLRPRGRRDALPGDLSRLCRRVRRGVQDRERPARVHARSRRPVRDHRASRARSRLPLHRSRQHRAFRSRCGAGPRPRLDARAGHREPDAGASVVVSGGASACRRSATRRPRTIPTTAIPAGSRFTARPRSSTRA